MQKIFFCLLILIGSLQLNAQNIVHDANAQVRDVGNFTKIRVSNAISLYLSQGTTQAVAVSSSDPSVTGRIRTEVSNGTLRIYVENGVWNGWNWSNKHLRAYVTFTTLESLEVSGACNVQLTDPVTLNDFKLELSGASSMNGTIKGDAIKFELSGASNAKLNITASDFDIEQTGASNFKGRISTPKADFDITGACVTEVDGNADNLEIDASGASNFKGYDLMAQYCKIEATGASSANINVSKDIQATASGGSSIHYSGGATLSLIDVSGGSSIKKKS